MKNNMRSVSLLLALCLVLLLSACNSKSVNTIDAAQKAIFQSVLADPTVWQAALEEGGVTDASGEQSPDVLDEYHVKTSKVYDLDGDGQFELLFDIVFDGYDDGDTCSFFYAIVNGKAKCVIAAYRSSGTIGGSQVGIGYDRKTKSNILFTEGSSGGWGGHSYDYNYYAYAKGEISLLATKSYFSEDLEDVGTYQITLYGEDTQKIIEDRFRAARSDGFVLE